MSRTWGRSRKQLWFGCVLGQIVNVIFIKRGIKHNLIKLLKPFYRASESSYNRRETMIDKESNLGILLVFCFSLNFVTRLPTATQAAEIIFELAKAQRYCFFETATRLDDDVMVDFQVQRHICGCAYLQCSLVLAAVICNRYRMYFQNNQNTA